MALITTVVIQWGKNNATRIGGVIVSVYASSGVDRGFISGVMVSVYASSVVDHGFEPRSGQTKDYKMFTSPLSTQH